MRPPPVLRRLLALLAGAWAPVPSTAAVPAADGERTIAVVKDGRVTRLVDSATGTTLWEVNTWATAVLGPDGTLYLGVDRDGGSDVFAFTLGDPKPTLVSDSVPDGALVAGVSAGGDRLWLLTHDYEGRQQTLPTALTALPLPADRVDLGRKRSKAPACAAVLSPGGSRLYMVAREGNAPLGIDVYETATFERVARFFLGRSFYCLAISSDGERLFADGDRALVTIDAATGEELAAVPLERRGVAPPYLGLATSTG